MADPNNKALIQSMLDAKNGGNAGAGLGDKISTDSSFLTNLDPRLAKPFLIGFADSSIPVFLWAAVIVAIAFVISFFIKAAPLRDKSAAQEAAEAAAH
jgi:hypothetical protein